MKLELHLFHLSTFYTIKCVIISGDNMRPIFVKMAMKKISLSCYLAHELEGMITNWIEMFE